METDVKNVIRGSVDFHLHVSPDPYRERVSDAHRIALEARSLGMRAVVLKSHHYPTAPLADLVRKLVKGIEIVGSLTLNEEVGGINPSAVRASAKLGARVIWMPTLSSVPEMERKGTGSGISILDRKGRILPEAKEILRIAKEYDLVIGTGHLSRREILLLFEEALAVGASKFTVTHPLKVAGTSLDVDTLRLLGRGGAYIEHCFVSTLSRGEKVDPSRIVEAIRAVGAERSLLSTDLGARDYMPPSEGMKAMVKAFLELGLSEGELSLLLKQNPSKLLDLG